LPFRCYGNPRSHFCVYKVEKCSLCCIQAVKKNRYTSGSLHFESYCHVTYKPKEKSVKYKTDVFYLRKKIYLYLSFEHFRLHFKREEKLVIFLPLLSLSITTRKFHACARNRRSSRVRNLLDSGLQNRRCKRKLDLNGCFILRQYVPPKRLVPDYKASCPRRQRSS
jgi:hypothetical protein